MEKTDNIVKLSPGVIARFWMEGREPDLFIDTDEWLECLADFNDDGAKLLQGRYDLIRNREEFKYAYDYESWDCFTVELGVTESDSYGAGWWNTYNYDCDLYDTLELYFFYYNDEEYVAIRRHLGGDVRGNYASPIIGRVYEGMLRYMIEVRVAAFEEPQQEHLFDPGRGNEPLDFEDTYEFVRWMDSENLELDWSDKANPKLSDGRNVYFDCSEIY